MCTLVLSVSLSEILSDKDLEAASLSCVSAKTFCLSKHFFLFLCWARYALPFTICPHKSQEIVVPGSDMVLRVNGAMEGTDVGGTPTACASGGKGREEEVGTEGSGKVGWFDAWREISEMFGSGIAVHSLESAVELKTLSCWFNCSRLASPEGVSQSVYTLKLGSSSTEIKKWFIFKGRKMKK